MCWCRAKKEKWQVYHKGKIKTIQPLPSVQSFTAWAIPAFKLEFLTVPSIDPVTRLTWSSPLPPRPVSIVLQDGQLGRKLTFQVWEVKMEN